MSTDRLQTRSGGPVGPVRPPSAHVAIPPGHPQLVRGSLRANVFHALRRLQFRITVQFASPARSSAIRPVS